MYPERVIEAVRSRVMRCAPAGNVGLHLIFDGLVVATALVRGRITNDLGRARQITRGSEGTYNYVFTGEGGGSWSCEVGDGTMRWWRGKREGARATVRVPVPEVSSCSRARPRSSRSR